MEDGPDRAWGLFFQSTTALVGYKKTRDPPKACLYLKGMAHQTRAIMATIKQVGTLWRFLYSFDSSNFKCAKESW